MLNLRSKNWNLKMNSYRTFILLLLSGIFLSANAQETLTLPEAVKLAFRHNLGIQVSNNLVSIADNSATIGNAGLLPSVNVSAGGSYSNQNTSLKFAGNIPDVETDGAESKGLNASIGLSYTLFDGLGSFYTFDKLKANGTMAEIQQRLTTEAVLLQVVNGFVEVNRLKENLSIIEKSVTISNERLERAASRFAFGGASQLEVLAAKVDLNNDSLARANLLMALGTAKRNLNFLMGRDVTQRFQIAEVPELDAAIDHDGLFETAKDNNAAILLAAMSMEVSELDLKLARAGKLPTVSLNANYGFNQTNNDASIVLENRNIGFSGNLALTWNLFAGNQRRTRIQNMETTIRNDQLKKREADLAMQRDFENAWANLLHQKETLRIESLNRETTSQNFERTKAMFELGRASALQFREAQLNLLRSDFGIINAKLNAKLAETELKRIAGKLVAE